MYAESNLLQVSLKLLMANYVYVRSVTLWCILEQCWHLMEEREDLCKHLHYEVQQY
jgi:hypothetical protein